MTTKKGLMFEEKDFVKMYNYSLSLTKNEDDAYDLLQTSLEKFYIKKAHTLEFPTSYLYQIIKNQFIDDQRKKKRWRHEQINEITHIPVLTDNRSTLNDLIQNQEMEIILNQLKPEERELLYLWAVEGYTVQAIAEQSGAPKGTILSRLHRIKKKLRNFIKNNADNYERLPRVKKKAG